MSEIIPGATGMERSAIVRMKCQRMLLATWLAGAAGVLPGCGGGQDFGNFQRSLGGDIGAGYSTSLSARYGGDGNRAGTGVVRGTYPRIETAFRIEKLPGDPFDYERVRVIVTLRKPDGSTVDVPAFFDGDTTWRMRYTPSAPGKYSVVNIRLNQETGMASDPEPREWDVRGTPAPGFVRIDPGDRSRFVFDNGERFYPLGHNVAWESNEVPRIPEIFARMQEAGENWSRVWTTHWDGKNLDWRAGARDPKRPVGQIDLEVARRWDAIVEAAEKHGIYFQMVLQHHGQYSTEVNPNWAENPYNAAQGGFLRNPMGFFTDSQARALTKRKLYYILARWGYSPSIMAFELFNEVESTDAGRARRWEEIALWHREMALFLRQHDLYRHLLTTSAHPALAEDNPIWETVDFLQTHTYAPDTVTAMRIPVPAAQKKSTRPHFIGEFGSADLKDPEGVTLHRGLWASLMYSPSGAAQYWDWVNIERNRLYDRLRAAATFVKASGLASQGSLTTGVLQVEASGRAALRLAPAGGWKKAGAHTFVVEPDGFPEGFEHFPSYLQGRSKREMMPEPLTLRVHFAQPGSVVVTIGQVAKRGARVVLQVDGQRVERSYPPAEKDYEPEPENATLRAEVPAGTHTITLRGEGEDWVLLREIALVNYAPVLATLARSGRDFCVAWIYHRDRIDLSREAVAALPEVKGRVALPELQSGRYRIAWWDTWAGVPLRSTEVEVPRRAQTVWLETPLFRRDIALCVTKTLRTAAKKNSASQDAKTGRPEAPSSRVSGPGEKQK
ncbi:MAG: DUF5060 domain-containing protein [Chloroherpetonaceae bacterium]|nr:DUF5060 domain-containing protein [Chthonomonadaceae bacterium]MDW8207081.1 DUF5060 domain-containing protein [Chloroherpetonaceae bacterium]